MNHDLKHFKDTLARLRTEYNALHKEFGSAGRRLAHNRMTSSQHGRFRVLHEQLAHFGPLFRALQAYQQPSMRGSMHGRRVYWAMLYMQRLTAIRQLVEWQQRLGRDPAFADLHDVLLYTQDQGQLKPAQTLRETQAGWSAQLVARRESQLAAYKALVASFTPAQCAWLRNIGGAQGHVTVNLQDLRKGGEG